MDLTSAIDAVQANEWLSGTVAQSDPNSTVNTPNNPCFRDPNFDPERYSSLLRIWFLPPLRLSTSQSNHSPQQRVSSSLLSGDCPPQPGLVNQCYHWAGNLWHIHPDIPEIKREYIREREHIRDRYISKYPCLSRKLRKFRNFSL